MGNRRRALSFVLLLFSGDIQQERNAAHTEYLFDADLTCPLFRTSSRTRGEAEVAFTKKRRECSFSITGLGEKSFCTFAHLKLVFSAGVEEGIRALVVGRRHENFGRPIEIVVVGRALGIIQLLAGKDAVLFEHHHQHFRVDDRARVEQPF